MITTVITELCAVTGVENEIQEDVFEKKPCMTPEKDKNEVVLTSVKP